MNTGDGTVVYDVAVALVWVTDGGPADQRNEAYALASCTSCTTVAVAFQVVLVVGQSDTVAPINLAVALNSGCVSCQTTALAVQLVVTITELPTDELQDRINQALARLDGVTDLNALAAEIQAVGQEIVTLLTDAGLVAAGQASSGATTTTTASTSSTTTSTTTAESTASTSSTSTSTSTTSTTASPTTTTTATAGGP